MKPKEYLVCQTLNNIYVYYITDNVSSLQHSFDRKNDVWIPVIEKSAYDELRIELNKYKNMMPKMVDSIPWANKLERHEAEKERIELNRLVDDIESNLHSGTITSCADALACISSYRTIMSLPGGDE